MLSPFRRDCHLLHRACGLGEGRAAGRGALGDGGRVGECVVARGRVVSATSPAREGVASRGGLRKMRASLHGRARREPPGRARRGVKRS